MKQNFTVRQGALDGVEAFLGVAQHRSFRKAAADLGVTPSAISQAVRTLEARIGAALFIRTTRSVGLTEAGARFLSRAKPAFEELVAASEVARDLRQPESTIRYWRHTGYGPLVVTALIVTLVLAVLAWRALDESDALGRLLVVAVVLVEAPVPPDVTLVVVLVSCANALPRVKAQAAPTANVFVNLFCFIFVLWFG